MVTKRPAYARVMVPYSIANFGALFDIAGLAIRGVSEEVSVRFYPGEEGLEIEVRGAGSSMVPTAPLENTAGIAALALLSKAGAKGRVEVEIFKQCPPKSGLGSSGASAAGVVAALSRALGANLAASELIEAAAQGEKASAGVPHYDNVSASLLGGIAIVHPKAKAVAKLAPPPNMGLAVVTPEVSYSTQEARAALPDHVRLKDYVEQCRLACLEVLAIKSGDLKLLGKLVTMERIVSGARARLIPGYSEAKAEALKAGAYGFSICGAGPSVFAIVDKGREAMVAARIAEAFERAGVRAKVVNVKPSVRGVRVVEVH